MKKTEYDAKLAELAGKAVTLDNAFEGLIFECSWGGMSDYYEVVRFTKGSIVLRKLQWETCAAPEGEEAADPVHRWTRIVRDAEGNTVPEHDWQGSEKLYTKRLRIREDRSFSFKSPNYSGDAYVGVCFNDYTEMYWG